MIIVCKSIAFKMIVWVGMLNLILKMLRRGVLFCPICGLKGRW